MSDRTTQPIRFTLGFLIAWVFLTALMMSVLYDVVPPGGRVEEGPTPRNVPYKPLPAVKHGLFFKNYTVIYDEIKYDIVGIVMNVGLDAIIMLFVCWLVAKGLNRRAQRLSGEA